MTEPDAASGFSFDARRWTAPEAVVAAASLVLLISLFLPWFGISLPDVMGRHVLGPVGPQLAQFFGLRSPVLWVALVLILAMLVLLVLRAGLGRVPFAAPPGDSQLLAGAAWMNLLLVILAFVIKPAIGGQIRLGGISLSVGWQVGAFIALIAAAVAAAAAALCLLPAPRKLPYLRRPPQQPTEG